MNSGEAEVRYPEASTGAAGVLCDSPFPPRPIEPDEPSEEQIAIYRAMTPEQRLQRVEQMYWSAFRMKMAWLRSLHPDWSEEQVGAETRKIFANARS